MAVGSVSAPKAPVAAPAPKENKGGGGGFLADIGRAISQAVRDVVDGAAKAVAGIQNGANADLKKIEGTPMGKKIEEGRAKAIEVWKR